MGPIFVLIQSWGLFKFNKNDFYYVANNIKKYRKMSLVFLENSKNCQNERVFEVAVMEWSRCMNVKTW